MDFSIKRFTDLWSFYHPRMLRMWLICGGLILLAYIGMVIDYTSEIQIGARLFSSIISYVCFGSLFVFALGRDRALQLQLPATPIERLVMMLLFCYVIVPIGFTLILEIISSIGSMFGLPHDLSIELQKNELAKTPLTGDLAELIKDDAPKFYITSMLTNITVLSCGLYGAIVARKSPIMTTIAGIFVGFAILFFISVAGGIFAALNTHLFENIAATAEAPAPESLVEMVKVTLFYTAGVGVLMLFISSPILYNKLKKNQI